MTNRQYDDILTSAVENPEAYYDKMAASYEDTVSKWGYTMPKTVAQVCRDELYFGENFQKAARVLDLGCGDGLVGAALIDLGFCSNELVGLDISNEMLSVARTKRIYTNLLKADLSKRLPVARDFDLITLVGTSTYLQPSALHVWLPHVVPGGYIVLTCKTAVMPAWEQEFDAMVCDGLIKRTYTSEPLHYLPNFSSEARENERVKIYALQKCDPDAHTEEEDEFFD